MTASVFSSQWYRVAGLHPRLRAQVRVSRQIYRDEVWYVLADGVSGRFHRMNASAYAFVGRCDGTRTVDGIADALLVENPEVALTQDEIVHLLVQLNQRGLLQCEISPDVEALFRREHSEQQQERRLAVNPLAFRVRLGDPTALLRPFDAYLKSIFSWPVLMGWVLVVVLGGIAAAMNFEALKTQVHTWMGTPRYLIIAWLVYPLIKTVHELAHGLAVRRFGGEVHQVGVSLLLLAPAPFVDASAASGFRRASQRVAVSAAGILTELVIAALAVMLWVIVQPGLVRDVALVVAFVGSVSTLLFNGNPLLRFDAYYVLCDVFDLPNLAPRSQAYWRYLLFGRCLRLPDVASPEPGRGERMWLVLYAPASYLYRVGLSIAIIGWVGSWSAILGILAGLGAVFALLLKPVAGFWRKLLRMPLPERLHRRVLLTAAGVTLLLGAFIVAVPMPFATVAQGVVWIPEQAQLRAGTDGFIVSLQARHGYRVEAGQVLATLEDHRLQVEGQRLESALEGLDADLYEVMVRDPVKAHNVEADIERTRAELVRVQERQALLSLRAGVSGQLVMPRQADMEGAFVPRGSLLGHILTGEAATLRVAVDQDSAALVRERTVSIAARLADEAGISVPAKLTRAVPAATERLPSAALGERSGGTHAVDPADKDHLATPSPVFIFDLSLPGVVRERSGDRAWVRFDHGYAPLAVQWGRRLKQLFLQQFNPDG